MAEINVQQSDAQNANRQYRHVMSRYDLTMLSMGGVIGSGWLFGAMYSAQYAGPAAILAWLIGGILMMILALPFIELSSMVPEAGGVIRYPQMSHGSLVSVTAAWAMFVAYALTPPIEAEAVVQYASGYIPGLFVNGSLTSSGLVISAILVILFFLLNYFGVRLFAKTNTIITTIKIIVPVVTMAVLLIAGLVHHGGVNLTNPTTGGFMPYGFHGVLAAISVGGIVFSYSGFRQALDMAAEGKNPKKDVPIAISTVLITAIILYVLLQLAFIVAVSASSLGHGWANVNFSSPFAQLAASLNIGWLVIVLYGDSIVSPGGSGLTYTGTQSRIYYAMPKNGYGPKWLLTLNKHGIPIYGQIVALVFGLAGLLPFPSWGAMVSILTATLPMSYALGGSSLMVMRKTAPEVHRGYSLGKQANWIAPASFAVGSLLFYWSGWPIVWQIDAVILVGIIIYFYYFFKNHLPKRDLKAGLWWLVYLAVMMGLSYLGSFGKGKQLIPFPYDSIVVIIISLAFYFWGVTSGYETQTLKDFKQGIDLDYEE